jgi:O-antigen/teichoic acid export membrane protein
MGVVKRQSIKQSLVVYISIALGTLNILFIAPAILTTEELGLINIVRDVSLLAAPFIYLGAIDLILKFFPVFRNEEKRHHGFLFLIGQHVTIGNILFLLLLLLFYNDITAYYSARSPFFKDYLPLVIPMAVLNVYSQILTYYISNFSRIAVPAIFNDLIPKAGTIALIVAYYYQLLPFSGIVWGLVGLNAVILVGHLWYVRHLGQLHLRPDFSFITKPLFRSMATFAGFGILISIAYQLLARIDLVMLASLSTLHATGVYSVAFFIINIIEVPKQAMTKIAQPLIAEHWQAERLDEIASLYKKGALNQLIAGTGLFLAIWASVDHLFELMPNGEQYASGKYVIFILGMARLIDMAGGFSIEIIHMSKYYRYLFFMLLFMAALNLTCHSLLIPIWDMQGAALATLISFFVYSLLKIALISWKFKMQPFSRQTLAVLFGGILVFAVGQVIPDTGFPLLDIAIKSSLSMLLFAGFILFFKVSPEINHLAADAWVWWRNKIK